MWNIFKIKQGRKVFATMVVGAFFLFFWLNGPLHIKEVLAHLEVESTKYSESIIVGDVIEKHDFNTIGDSEVDGEGWSLLMDKKKQEKTFHLMTSEQEEGVFSEERKELLTNHVKKLFTNGINSTPLLTENGMCLSVVSNESEFIYLESQHKFNHIRGYGGPIQIGVLITEEGKIKQVQHISSRETESYLSKISNQGFYNRFITIPLEKSHRIDAVSGATLTTEAIAETTSELIGYYQDSLEDRVEDRNLASFSVWAENTLWWILHITLIGLLFVYGIQKKYKKTKRDIRLLSFFSVLYIGFFMNNSFTYVTFLHPFLGTSLSSLVALYAFFSLLGAIWGKNLYCKYVCPYGHLQRIGLNLSKNKFSKKFFISNKWIKRIRDGITVILITGILLGMRSWGNFELFPDIFGLDFTSMWFALSILLIVINLRYPFIWCRIACPTGAVLDKISDFSNKKLMSKKA